eukprot:Tbor_TRINITY_DN5570_c0_g1::TRINITY_DN5570_c0_g1_i1::g.13892::m.13892
MSNERSALVWSEFDRCVASQSYTSSQKAHAKRMEPNPFEAICDSISIAAIKAIQQSNARMTEALKAMGQCWVNVADIEANLLLAEAELTSIASLVTGVSETIASTKVKMQEELTRERKLQTSSIIGFFLSMKKTDHINEEEDHGELTLLQHYSNITITLSCRISQKRLEVSICREELETHKSSLREPSALWIRSTQGHTLMKTEKPKNSPSVHDNNIKQLAQQLRDVGGRGNKAFETILQTSTNSVATTMLSLARRTRDTAKRIRRGDTDVMSSQTGNTAGSSVSNESKVQRYVYSPEERNQLETYQKMILLEEKSSVSSSAKEIEATVHELGQLTSLMRERVAEQDEKLQELEENAIATETNLVKASDQLYKATLVLWTPTRRLIMLTWILTGFLLIANWLIR